MMLPRATLAMLPLPKADDLLLTGKGDDEVEGRDVELVLVLVKELDLEMRELGAAFEGSAVISAS